MKANLTTESIKAEQHRLFDLMLEQVRQHGHYLIDKEGADYCFGTGITEVALKETQDVIIHLAADNKEGVLTEGIDLSARILRQTAVFAECNCLSLKVAAA